MKTKELEEKYEELLELLPQDDFSKAGTPPNWVVDAVNKNILLKQDTQDDVQNIINHCETFDEIVEELQEYFDIKS
ncbi:MAG: hypothetical protein LKF42_09125 [Streptococcaceae bacterium]|jgi:ABC-type glycerol-3-phosphate transport system substrate-binding protein|nr:hypothetical protein [Streptococcaceae bacterium]